MYEISKKYLFNIFFLSPLFFVIVYFIVFRDPSLPDYVNYEYMFYNQEKENIEVSFSFLKNIFNNLNYGFYYLLLVYALIGFYLKILFVYHKIKNYTYFFIFLMGYFLSFFVVWDLIQIRYSSAITFFIIGIFQNKVKYRIIFFILSILFHYSLLFPVFLYFIYYYVKNIYLRIISIPFLCIFSLFLISKTHYAQDYSLSNYLSDPINFFSIRNFLTLVLILNFSLFYKYVSISYKDKIYGLFYVSLIMYINVFIFSYVIPSAADRLFTLTSFLFYLIQFFIFKKYYKYLLILITFCYSVPYFYVQIINKVFI